MTATPTAGPPASLATWPITKRRVRFDWTTSPLHWIPGDAFASHAVNEFSFLLTSGERFFCRLFRQALPHITDDKLRADVEVFIQQEAVHLKAHRDSIDDYLSRYSIGGGRFEQHTAYLFDIILADRPFDRDLPESFQHPWLVFRVGIVAAIEHFTAALGEFVLSAESWDDLGADPIVADLFRWHGAEEIEHRTVAYDLYRHLGGTWTMRALAMTLVLPTLVGLTTYGTTHLLLEEQPTPSRGPRLFTQLVRGWRRSAKIGNFPPMTWFPRHALRFLRPGYHPIHQADTEQALAYLATSPAVLPPREPAPLRSDASAERRHA